MDKCTLHKSNSETVLIIFKIIARLLYKEVVTSLSDSTSASGLTGDSVKLVKTAGISFKVKDVEKSTMEVKRMYVPLHKRGRGIASVILKELETWCLELNYKKCILETGQRQTEAIELYKKNNYKIIPNFGQYANVENSVCFEKYLIK